MTELWEWMWQFLEKNQFASGGVLVGIIGGMVVVLRSLPGRIVRGLRRLVVVEVEILDTDEAFQWLSLWLAKHHRPMKGRNLQVLTARRQLCGSEEVPKPVAMEPGDDENKLPPIRLLPGIGRHLVWYARRPILVRHHRDDGTASGGGGAIQMLFRPERFVLYGLVFYRRAIEGLLNAAREEAMPPPGKLRMFLAVYSHWRPLCEIDGRALNTVVLPADTANALVRDIENFRAREDWYMARGIPWRRGYLLAGPPGNGKTSLIRAVATYFNLHLGIVNLASSEISDEGLLELFASAASNMAVVIEDVDCLYDHRQRSKETSNKVSFSGLLNAVDGLASSRGRLLFLTTNHPEKLDAALMRSGRIDMRLDLAQPTKEQARLLFRLFFPESRLEMAADFASRINGQSMADLQEHLLRFPESPELALSRMGD